MEPVEPGGSLEVCPWVQQTWSRWLVQTQFANDLAMPDHCYDAMLLMRQGHERVMGVQVLSSSRSS
jgi:hypothetical protein